VADLTRIFGGQTTGPATIERAPEEQLRDAIADAGLTAPDSIVLDGKLRRFASGTKGKPGMGDKSGWYVAFGDGVPAGSFGDWRSGIVQNWRANMGRPISMLEEQAIQRRISEARALREQEEKRKHEQAAETVHQIWIDGVAGQEHPYQTRKGIGLHGARVAGDGRLIVPLFTPENELSSLQYIDADGTKRYHPGGRVAGCSWYTGADDSGPVYVAEGFATAASITEATERKCFIAYSASNIPSVVGMLRERYGAGKRIVVVADHDPHGVGRNYADQAAAKFGAFVIMPPEVGTDANDFVQAGGDLRGLLHDAHENLSSMRDRMQMQFASSLSTEFTPPDELVEGLITRNSLTVIYGDSNSGKTFFTLELSRAIAEGVEAFGRKTDMGLVLYLATEAPVSVKTRMQAMRKFHGCKLENLAIVPVPLNFYNGDADAADLIELIREVEGDTGKKVQMIVADTFARMASGANENSGEDVGPIMGRFDQVSRETEAAIVIIHHSGKDAARGARGWSGMRAHIDTEMEVTFKDNIRKVEVTKQRELPSRGEEIFFRLEILEMGIGKFGNKVTTCVAVEDKEAKAESADKPKNPVDSFRKDWERAWFYSGALMEGPLPYLSRSGLKDWLVTQKQFTDRTAENKMSTADSYRKGSIILNLFEAEMIEPRGQGWVMVDKVHGPSLAMRRLEFNEQQR
jgi:putative DNA primase/helicase